MKGGSFVHIGYLHLEIVDPRNQLEHVHLGRDAHCLHCLSCKLGMSSQFRSLLKIEPDVRKFITGMKAV